MGRGAGSEVKDPNAGQRVPIFVSNPRRLYLPWLPILSSNTLIMIHYDSSAIPVYFSRAVPLGRAADTTFSFAWVCCRWGTFSGAELLLGPTWVRWMTMAPLVRDREGKIENRSFGDQKPELRAFPPRHTEPMPEHFSVRSLALGFSQFPQTVSVAVASHVCNRHKRGSLPWGSSSYALAQFNLTVLVMGGSRLARLSVEAKLLGYCVRT